MSDPLEAHAALTAAMRKRRQENDDRWLVEHRAKSPEEQRREMDTIRDADGSLAREWQRMLREHRRAVGRSGRTARPRQRPRGAGRPAGSRTGASSTTSGNDPGGNDPEPPPPLAPAALAEAQRILDGAARRRLAERTS